LTSFFTFEFKDPLQKAEEAEEPKPESKKRITTVTKLSEGLGPIEAGTRVFEDIDSEKQPAAKIRRGIMRKLVCCEVTLQEKETSFFSPGFKAGFLQVIPSDSCFATCTVGYWK